MKTLGSMCAGAACIALLLAPTAEAHKMTVKQAKAALKPVAAEIAPQIAPKIAAKLPGATISKTGVAACEIVKKGHRADCVLTFTIAGASTGETECAVEARVQFRSKKSKELKVAVASVVACLFPVPLD